MTDKPMGHQIEATFYYETREVLVLLSCTRKTLNRLPIRRKQLCRGKAIFYGQDVIDYLRGTGKGKLRIA